MIMHNSDINLIPHIFTDVDYGDTGLKQENTFKE